LATAIPYLESLADDFALPGIVVPPLTAPIPVPGVRARGLRPDLLDRWRSDSNGSTGDNLHQAFLGELLQGFTHGVRLMPRALEMRVSERIARLQVGAVIASQTFIATWRNRRESATSILSIWTRYFSSSSIALAI
jgi:hypothetical protein